MSGEGPTGSSGSADSNHPTTRRRLLATAAAVATTGLAGCGYRAGAGELDWEETVGPSSVGPWGGERRWLGDGERLVSVRNRGGRTYDIEADRWVDREDARVTAYDATGDPAWETVVDEQFDGEPAMDDAAVYLPLERGGVAAVSRSLDSGDVPAWTSPRTDDPLDLTAGDGLVVGRAGSTLHAFDAETGEQRFATALEAPIVATAVAGDRVWTATEDGGLAGFDPDGAVRADPDIPGTVRWLEPAGSAVLVGLARPDGLRLLEPDGAARWTLDVATDSRPPRVVDDRCYLAASGDLRAVDLASGDPLWERDAPFDGPFVADATGLYGPRSVADGFDTECRIAAVGVDGEDRWDVRTVDDVDCGSEPYRLEDRLVLVDDERLYAFRLAPERKRTVF